MKLQELCMELKKFPPYKKQSVGYIIDAINNLCEEYIKLLRDVEDSEFDKLETTKKETLIIVSEVKELILKSINDYLCGKTWEATENIFKRFFDRDNKINKIVISGRIEKNRSFYRMRSCDTSHLYKKEEMFHIPFELRGKVTNQRYSMSGYPCLYFGSSLYVCWEELDRPNIDTSNMTVVESESDLFFVNMKMPNRITDKNHLYKIPLVISSSLKVIDSKNTFKVEYIIPQIILQCIIKRNMQGGVSMKDGFKKKVDGVMYTSTHFSDENRLFNDINLYTNYVIPVKTSGKEGLCPELCKTFKISKETISPNILKIFNGFNQSNINVINENMSHQTEVTSLYKKSLFGVIEKRLVDNDKINLKPNTENKKSFKITKAQIEALIEHEVQERIKKS